ncbi:nitrate regulatory gene2 protein [Neltuma alba]|uniref:nitrate regulatory gene2 protein n=1 Tax=Neltuma alba TaxID=207710 RepID=UPI0010A4871E|nr:nitrate regulatory gene2 protein-like [Prosopis alba]
MGCTQSKIENEEAVARCKERKHLMKEAVSARNAFAAAHSSYATYLKNTGAALSDFSEGEVQNPQFGPTTVPNPSLPMQPSFEIPPPPPPPHNIPPAPLHRSATMPEMMAKPQMEPVGTIIEEEEEDKELENDGALNNRLRRRRSKRNSGGSSRGGTKEMVGEEEEEARPPAPPPLSKSKPATQFETNHPMPAPHPAFEYFFPPMENTPGPSLSTADEEVNINKEEIERKEFNEKPNIVRGRNDEVPEPVPTPENVPEPPPAPQQQAMMLSQNGKSSKKVKQGQVSIVEGNIANPKVNLIQIFNELDDHFLKASESAHEVSKMLEATRMHYHSNFADNRGHIDHSARLMRVITWNRSFRGMPNMEDGKDDFDSEGHETHATVLDKLLAWEKKLYDEVKTGELMKFEYQRKVASLNKLKKRGKSSDALERAKAAVSHLHTRYIVDMQSLDSTVSEISRLRDEQLYPRLVQLVDGMATMWGIMRAHHENQSNIALALASLDDSQSPKMTTEHHHDRTYQLLVVVQEWHSQFEKLMSNQRRYIRALNNWLKLNLVHIESNLKEKVSSPPRVQKPPIHRLLLAWQDSLEKLPDEVARTAISNFAALIDTIFHLQAEEMHLKQKCEETQKELNRKKRHFEDWYRKYMERKIPEEPDPDRPQGNNAIDEVVTEKQFVVEQVKKRLEDEEEAYARQCDHVRQKSLVTLKNRLPELFRNMSDFALQCSKMYSELRRVSQNLNTDQSSP